MAIVLIWDVRTKKNANYGVQLFLKRPFRLGCLVLVFFLEIHDVLKFSDIQLCSQGKMKQRPFLSSAFVHRSPISFHSFFFLLFSLFFLLSFFFINYDKVFFFSFHLLLFFVLVFPCVSNAARRCRQRSRTGRSTPLVLNPFPSPQKVLLNRG